MKISVVTISFNQAPFLERAIRSVLEQDHRDVEFIVVDAGSTDGSREIIGRYRDRFARVILEPDEGPADGLNKGFAHATGDILAYINADDALISGALGEAASEFASHPEMDLIYGHGYLVDGEDRQLRRLRSAPFDLWRAVHGSSVIVQQATFIRSQAFRDIRGFNAANRSCWDYELLVDLALAGKRFHRVDRYWGVFRLYPNSLTGSMRHREALRRDFARIYEKATGRPKGWCFAPMAAAARLSKWIVDPVSLAISISDSARLELGLARGKSLSTSG